jgi:site-specific DNA-methyltransferase (adenine-specific)
MFTLHNGDCLQVMPTLPAGSVDAIITDLPYGTTACAWDSIIPLAPMWEQVKRVLKPTGVFISTASQPFTSILICSNVDMFRHEWIWNKNTPTGFLNVKKAPMKQHESVCVFAYGSYTYNPQKERKEYKATRRPRISKGVNPDGIYGDDLERVFGGRTEYRFPKTILNIDWGGGWSARDREHPTQKPVSLYEYLIRTYTNEGETVLDICMGSGTTIEAAENTYRNSIGIEKEQGYFLVAEKRNKSAVLQQRLFTPSNNRLHWTGGESPALPSQSTLEGFTAPEADTIPPASQ